VVGECWPKADEGRLLEGVDALREELDAVWLASLVRGSREDAETMDPEPSPIALLLHLALRALIPVVTFTLSPTFATPISFNVAWSKSRMTSPVISFSSKTEASWGRRRSVSHWPTCAVVQVFKKTEKCCPLGVGGPGSWMC